MRRRPARGFGFGRGRGSAAPMTWSTAQFLPLAVCPEERCIVRPPNIVAEHFLKRH